jgi:hypothetical protein
MVGFGRETTFSIKKNAVTRENRFSATFDVKT